MADSKNKNAIEIYDPKYKQPRLEFHGHLYGFSKKTPGKEYWRCAKRTCNGRMTRKLVGGQECEVTRGHSGCQKVGSTIKIESITEKGHENESNSVKDDQNNKNEQPVSSVLVKKSQLLSSSKAAENLPSSFIGVPQSAYILKTADNAKITTNGSCSLVDTLESELPTISKRVMHDLGVSIKTDYEAGYTNGHSPGETEEAEGSTVQKKKWQVNGNADPVAISNLGTGMALPLEQFLQSDPTGPVGFDRGLQPAEIVGITNVRAKVMVLVRWVGSKLADLVDMRIVKEKCPDLLLRFVEGRVGWKNEYLENIDD